MDFSDTLLLTVHGLNSDNEGFKRITQTCEEHLPKIQVENFFWGQVLPWAQLNTQYCQLLFKTLRDRLAQCAQSKLGSEHRKLFVVAHSFGTLAVIRALEMGVPNLSIDGLILLGSIVPRDQLWDGFVGTGCLSCPPLAIIRPFDRIVPRARLVNGGPSGSMGFIATGRYRPREIYKNGSHTSYDPDDAPEIISAIKGGIASLPTKHKTVWLNEQSRGRQFALRCYSILDRFI